MNRGKMNALGYTSSFASSLPYYSSSPYSSSSSSSSPSYGFPKENKVHAFRTTSEWRKHFNNYKGSSQLMVIDFTAKWCGPCKYLEPAITDLAARFSDVIFVKIDVDECMEVAQQYGIETMPTVLLIKQGQEVDRIVGVRKDELEKKVAMHRMQVLNPYY